MTLKNTSISMQLSEWQIQMIYIYIYMTGVLSRYKLKRMLAPGEQQYKLVSFIYQDASNI